MSSSPQFLLRTEGCCWQANLTTAGTGRLCWGLQMCVRCSGWWSDLMRFFRLFGRRGLDC